VPLLLYIEQVGDITKEIDTRVKDEVAKMRGKDDYERELGYHILCQVPQF